MAQIAGRAILPRMASRRIRRTDAPCIVGMQKMMEEFDSKDTISLAQGIVYWKPPEKALKRAAAAVYTSESSMYGADGGITELRDRLREKVRTENKLTHSDIMVTTGANQAFTNVVLTLCDVDDDVVLFPPYYFNHMMAFQMTGVKNILLGERHPQTFQPSSKWIEETLKANEKVKVVVITNPCNPTGVLTPLNELKKISELCKNYGCWLVLDNTYEYFVYGEGNEGHSTIEGEHILNIFSFSKAYGMMGWRCGYIAFVDSQAGGKWSLGSELLKAQDTIPICPPIISQYVALGALEAGKEWVTNKINEDVIKNRNLVRECLISTLGEQNVYGGDGAIYFFAKLPDAYKDDVKVVRYIAEKYGVVIIPGTACGYPGYVRVSYANLTHAKFSEGVDRLKLGLSDIVKNQPKL